VGAVDLYWAHVEDPAVPVAELVTTFGGLVAADLVGQYGVSNHPSWLVERIRAAAERAELPMVSGYQQRYTYFQPLPGAPVEGQPIPLGMLTADGLDFLRRHPEVSGSVHTATLLGGYDRADRPLPPAYQHVGNEHRRAGLGRVADRRGLRAGQVVLARLRSGRPVLTPVVGVSTVDQLEQAWTGATTRLTADEMAVLDVARPRAAAADPRVRRGSRARRTRPANRAPDRHRGGMVGACNTGPRPTCPPRRSGTAEHRSGLRS
jgi:aryl-alcohol dehydrogenase-like predicted oxidoreductase